MFYILEEIPVPPTLVFDHISPSQLEVFQKISNALERRTEIVSGIFALSKDKEPPSFDPASISEKLPFSLDLVI